MSKFSTFCVAPAHDPKAPKSTLEQTDKGTSDYQDLPVESSLRGPGHWGWHPGSATPAHDLHHSDKTEQQNNINS